MSRCVSVVMCLIASVAVAQPESPACVAGTEESFLAIGVQTYQVPAGATSIFIVAEGASGGGSPATGMAQSSSVVERGEPVPSFVGGFAAHIAAQLDFNGPATLNVSVGDNGQFSGGGAGGGGGSFVYTAGGVLLVAAGGGGGAGFTDDGHDAELGESGGSADPTFGGAGGTNGSGGGAATSAGGGNGGGGGGFLGDGGDGPLVGVNSGAGGSRISPPGDAAGGAGASGGNGGFGGGGGGGQFGGGGGGGYSGGGGGYGANLDGGGGGGSFHAPGSALTESFVLAGPSDGSVTICVAETASAPEIPTLSPWLLASLAAGLLGAGVWLVRRG